MLTKKIAPINEIALTICEILLVLMVAMVFIQITSRVFVGSSFRWTEEVARYMFIYIVLLAGAVGFGSKSHISVDILYSIARRPFRKVLALVSAVCVSSIGMIFMVQGSVLIQKTMVQASPGLGIKMGYIYIIFPIAGTLMLINIWAYTVDYLRGHIKDAQRGGLVEAEAIDTESLSIEDSPHQEELTEGISDEISGNDVIKEEN